MLKMLWWDWGDSKHWERIFCCQEDPWFIFVYRWHQFHALHYHQVKPFMTPPVWSNRLLNHSKKFLKFTENSPDTPLLTSQLCKEKYFIALRRFWKQFSLGTFLLAGKRGKSSSECKMIEKWTIFRHVGGLKWCIYTHTEKSWYVLNIFLLTFSWKFVTERGQGIQIEHNVDLTWQLNKVYA